VQPRKSYYWASRCLLAIALGGNLGLVLHLAETRWGVPVGDGVLEASTVLLIAVAAFCLVRLYVSLGKETLLTEPERVRLRRSVLLTGPAGALAAWMRLRGENRAR
jgi:hypothetical protein